MGQYGAEGKKEYREARKRILQKQLGKVNQDWICAQHKRIETCHKTTGRVRISW